MNRRLAAVMIFLATLAMLAACCVAMVGCVRGSPDSWTAAVLVRDEFGNPCPSVWVDVRPSIADEPYAVPFTNSEGLAFVRVREGDIVYLPDDRNEEWYINAHTTICKFTIRDQIEERDKP